jgi:hypothetical protein
MLRIHHCCLRVAACVAVSRVIKAFAMSATWCVSILAPVIGTSLVLTTAAVAGPTPAPTATPTAAPIVSGQTKPGFEIESAQSAESASASSSSLTAGSNVNISHLGGNHLEVAISINPTNPDNLFAFSNAELGTAMTGSIGLFAAYSIDGGENWDPVDPTDWIIADGGDSLVTARADPSAAWDDFGNLFITYVSPQFEVPVAVSTNGGMTFSHLETLGVAVADQPTVAVGPIIGGTSSVWVTYKQFSAYPVRSAVRCR